jgi:uncharacterized protein (DUF1684 family)
MKRAIVVLLLLLLCRAGIAQSYGDSILEFRKHYVAELLADKRSPLKFSQAEHLAFFQPDVRYRVWGDFTPSPGSKPFLVETHSGKRKPYQEYGTVQFLVKDTLLTLHIYQSMDLMNDAAHKNYLFIPFNDVSNYITTYAGGRYIDLSTDDIKDGRLLLDFNKCYNPYCAYKEGYSCPIPPRENYLQIAINAGEKIFVE